MALVDAIAERWGVLLRPDRKVPWCELATGLAVPNGHVGGAGVTRAEALLSVYTASTLSRETRPGRVSRALAEEAVIDVITDFLHWLRAHGCDMDEVLDRAQTQFEVQLSESGDSYLSCWSTRHSPTSKTTA